MCIRGTVALPRTERAFQKESRSLDALHVMILGLSYILFGIAVLHVVLNWSTLFDRLVRKRNGSMFLLIAPIFCLVACAIHPLQPWWLVVLTILVDPGSFVFLLALPSFLVRAFGGKTRG